MSNTEASRIYEQIIDDVVGDSRQDFEDSGIDEATLQDLRTIWRENLAQTKVANFSWAPELNPDGANILDNGVQFPDLGNGEVKREDSLNVPQISSGANFELEVNDESGEIAKELQKQKSELKKERTLASLDSDDINSDLDDSDEDDQGSEDEADDADGMIILCLYEKVLRVKNKWKCNLKDGIVNINGKDYAFAKGTGESEW